MKILLSWLYDHIAKISLDISVADIVTLFNKTTAEIEHVTPTRCIENTSVAKVIELKEQNIVALDVVSGQEILLPLRKQVDINQLFVVVKEQELYRFATMKDCGGAKELLLPQVFVKESEYNSIPAVLQSEDVIIDIDNKSITHRPDLWSHRGVAREVAAMFDFTLKNIETFLVEKDVSKATTEILATEKNPFSITIEDTANCSRFAGLYIEEIAQMPTPLWMAIRLARLDCKPIDILVDLTNYVLFDIGQPMHVFDAEKLSKKRIIVRKADKGEILETLDDEKTELSEEDIVIADGLHAISLAGIMGGTETAVNSETKSVFLESANFDPTVIRRSAQRLKKRTESSMRFEKSLDLSQNIIAIKRYLQLLEDAGVQYHVTGNIQSVGLLSSQTRIHISHECIEKKLGTSLSWQKVHSILQALEFQVQKKEIDSAVVYDIIVPSFRATKDIAIVEDIVEEVGRFVGYETIEPVMPKMPLQPRDTQAIHRRRQIKKLLSYTGLMRELYTYSFFDESFLQYIDWSPRDYIEVKNPVSQNYTRLLTTVIPNLLKAVQENAEQYKKIHFYEWARVWKKENKSSLERQVVSGVLYDQHHGIDFYSSKTLIEKIYASIGMQVTYQSIKNLEYPWVHPYQSAHIIHEEIIVGMIGMITDDFVKKLTPGGALFFFECNAEVLMHYKQPIVQYKQTSKYPAIVRDVSMTLPVMEQVEQIKTLIRHVDERINGVSLVDFFQKDEWVDKRAVTIRITIQDEHKTLTSEDADEVCLRVYDVLKIRGAQIR